MTDPNRGLHQCATCSNQIQFESMPQCDQCKGAGIKLPRAVAAQMAAEEKEQGTARESAADRKTSDEAPSGQRARSSR